MSPGWDARWPGRYEYELSALREAGVEYQIDQDALDKGVLVLEVRFPYGDRTVKGRAVFPDYYPEFRPRVFAEPLGLTHHQSPASGDLCLLGRRGDQWQPGYTLAWLLTDRVAALADTNQISDPAEAGELEDIQAEPYTAYYSCRAGTAVFVDGDWSIPKDVDGGILLVGLMRGSERKALRAAVLEVRDFDGQTIARAPEYVRHLTAAATYEWAWLRKHEAVPFDSPHPVFGELAQLVKTRRLRLDKAKVRDVKVDVIGLLVPEETGHRKSGEGWIFAMRESRYVRDGRKGRTQVRPAVDYNYIRAAYGGDGDILQRVPSIRPLRDSVIAMVGVGALGGTAAVEFARNAVGELRLLDGDVVEPGPTVRWPLGISATGLAKVDALAAFIRENYPWSRVICYEHELGVAPDVQKRRDPDAMAEIINGASLIFDATARTDVSRLLSLLARKAGIPYVCVIGTEGGWGGMIFRYSPGREQGCWHCLELAREHGRKVMAAAQAVDPEAPIVFPAPVDPGGITQGRGCADVTFTGTSFDMSMLALDGVRKAVGAICGPNGAYPDGDWDVAVVSLRDANGGVIPPNWDVQRLRVHPRCSYCR